MFDRGGEALTTWEICQGLYRASMAEPEFELLLDLQVEVDDDRALARSRSVILGGAPRNPHIVRDRTLASLLRLDGANRWTVTHRSPSPASSPDATAKARGAGTAALVASSAVPPGVDRSGFGPVMALLARYGRCADRRATPDGWLECFVADAVVVSVSPRPGRPPVTLSGRDAIVAAFDATAGYVATTHLTANVVATIGAGAELELSSCFVRLDHVDDSLVVGSFGRYRDRALQCPDGLWRLTRREIRLEARRRPEA